MTEPTKIYTQANLDEQIAKGRRDFSFEAEGTFKIILPEWISVTASALLKTKVEIVAYGSATVWAYGSATVRAYGSATVRACDSATVTAYDSATVWAYDSATVRAYGLVSLHLWSKIKATLSAKCHVFLRNKGAKAEGGTQTDAILTTPLDWCDFYGVAVDDAGVATVFKGVRDCFGSFHDRDFKWTPGTAPKAPSFDDKECSYGLHFSPTPRHTLTHNSDAKRFVACPVRVSDMLVFFEGQFPHKCKAPELAAPCWEVDIDGNRIEQKGGA